MRESIVWNCTLLALLQAVPVFAHDVDCSLTGQFTIDQAMAGLRGMEVFKENQRFVTQKTERGGAPLHSLFLYDDSPGYPVYERLCITTAVLTSGIQWEDGEDRQQMRCSPAGQPYNLEISLVNTGADAATEMANCWRRLRDPMNYGIAATDACGVPAVDDRCVIGWKVTSRGRPGDAEEVLTRGSAWGVKQ